MLQEVLGSRTRARILSALVRAPEGQLHLRELVRASGGSISSVQAELERLEALAIVRSQRDDAGRRQVSLVSEHPYHEPITRFVVEEARASYFASAAALESVPPVAAAEIGRFVDAIVTGFNPVRVVLFGSYARGEADEESDVDLLVMLDSIGSKKEAVAEILHAIGDRGLPVDVVPVTVSEASGGRGGTVVATALGEGKALYERSA